MDFGTSARTLVQILDSHTEGEPTRVVVGGAPVLAGATLAEKLESFRAEHDGFRTGVLLEPRGSEVLVGALLLEPEHAGSAAGVIFFNDVGYLGMCGHGTIGLVTTLAHLGRIGPGEHRIDTPVGTVSTCLHEDGRVSVENVPSYRYRAGVEVEVAGLGVLTGDVAWGGNWFFLTSQPVSLHSRHRAALVDAAIATRTALAEAGITGRDGALVDHIEFVGPPEDAANSARNFVLCPGAAFDRSPCGTGTSAKMACLYAEGRAGAGRGLAAGGDSGDGLCRDDLRRDGVCRGESRAMARLSPAAPTRSDAGRAFSRRLRAGRL